MTKSFIDDESRWLGARAHASSGTRFRLWAPHAAQVELVACGKNSRRFKMRKESEGYFATDALDLRPGDLYKFHLSGPNGARKELPDPASRFQPEGPHGPSQIVEREFAWTDSAWRGLPLDELVIYELHVGTFSEAGNFAGVVGKLAHLKALGITAIEIMPVAQFAGKRNWGYDGVGLFAAQNSYGDAERISPVALKSLVNACHEHGIAVLLDVVYNHLGPEGNYLSSFGPYFQSKYKTPWGDALNYDGEGSDEVRRYFLENARQWLEEFHFDGLRLDAVHAIFDTSARPFLEHVNHLKSELAAKLGRPLHVIAESDANDSRILHPPEKGGLGFDAQWADDLHHTVHALVSGEKFGYYSDYGRVEQLADLFRDGVAFDGRYSRFRRRSFGRPYTGVTRHRLVVCAQNHDQIGNRMNGERLISLVGKEKMKLAAACVLLSPGLPLLFMGEEFAEKAPFLYFIDHTDRELLEAVRRGRREEFSSFAWQGEPPDPAATETFEKSKLNWRSLEESELAKAYFVYYRQLIQLSKWLRKHRVLEEGHVTTELLADGQVLRVCGKSGNNSLEIFFSFAERNVAIEPERGERELEIVLDSSEDGFFSSGDRVQEGVTARAFEETDFSLKPYSAVAFRAH